MRIACAGPSWDGPALAHVDDARSTRGRGVQRERWSWNQIKLL